MINVRNTDTIRGFLTIPKGSRVVGTTPVSRRKVPVPTSVPLPCQGTRDGLSLSIGIDGVGLLFVNPTTIKKSWITVTMRRGAYDRFNTENGRSYVPGGFYHDGGTNPILERVEEYLAHFRD